MTFMGGGDNLTKYSSAINTKITLTITSVKFLSNLPGASELKEYGINATGSHIFFTHTIFAKTTKRSNNVNVTQVSGGMNSFLC